MTEYIQPQSLSMCPKGSMVFVRRLEHCHASLRPPPFESITWIPPSPYDLVKKRKTARVSKPNHAKPVVKLVYRSFATQKKEQHSPHAAQEVS